MRLTKIFILLFVAIAFVTTVSGQTSKAEKKAAKLEKKNRPPQKGDFYIAPLPVIGSNPAFGFMYGAGVSISSFLGEPKTTKISSALIGFTFTTKQQFLFTAKSTIFSANNEWLFNGDWRYVNSSQPTFGLGTGPSSSKLAGNGFEYSEGVFSKPIETSQMMSFNFYRFYEIAAKKMGKDFYAGIGYHLDYFENIDDKLLDLTASPPVITSFYAYNVDNNFSQTKSVTSGVSFNGTLDSRDNQNAPHKGRYANATFKVNPTFLGSYANSTQLFLEYRDYLNLTPNDHKNLLAFWFVGNFTTSGTLSYMNLPAIGWDQYAKTGRGYTQGRFRGQQLMYGEIEYRRHIYGTTKKPDMLGMVAFANATTTNNKGAKIGLFDYIVPAAGIGLRYNLSSKSRTNIGIDFAWVLMGALAFIYD